MSIPSEQNYFKSVSSTIIVVESKIKILFIIDSKFLRTDLSFRYSLDIAMLSFFNINLFKIQGLSD